MKRQWSGQSCDRQGVIPEVGGLHTNAEAAASLSEDCVQASGDIALGCSDVSVLVGGGDPRAVSLASLSLEGVAPASADLLTLGWYSMAKVGGLWMWPGEYVLASIAMVAHKLS